MVTFSGRDLTLRKGFICDMEYTCFEIVIYPSLDLNPSCGLYWYIRKFSKGPFLVKKKNLFNETFSPILFIYYYLYRGSVRKIFSNFFFLNESYNHNNIIKIIIVSIFLLKKKKKTSNNTSKRVCALDMNTCVERNSRNHQSITFSRKGLSFVDEKGSSTTFTLCQSLLSRSLTFHDNCTNCSNCRKKAHRNIKP